MNCYFYTCNDNDNVIDKTLENKSDKVEIVFLNKDNFYNPIIRLKKNLFVSQYNYNYCEIDESFYFIRSVNYFNNDMILLSLQKDLLKTFEDDILNNGYGEIISSENVINNKRVTMDTNETLEILSETEIENPFTEKEDVLICVYGNYSASNN